MKRKKEEEEREVQEEERGVQSMTQPCRNNVYFHNFHIQFLFWIKSKGVGNENSMCVGRG